MSQEQQHTRIFDKEAAFAVKGIAIVMMLIHHCFGFSEYWLEPAAVSGVMTGIASGFKICVAIFAFITGYGFHFSKSQGALRKVVDFLLQYWVQLFVIFLPIACVNFSFSGRHILLNMFALHDNIILFAWYVFFHLIVLVTFPFVKKLINGNLIRDLLVVLIGGYGCTILLYILPTEHFFRQVLVDCSVYYPTVGMGYIFAKHRLFEIISEKVRFRIVTAFAVCLLVFVLRSRLSVIKGFTFDCFYAPCMVLALTWFTSRCGMLRCSLMFMGKHSFHMWLFHSIFFSTYTREVMQPLVSWSASPCIRFLLVLGLSLLAALLVQNLFCFVFQRKHRIHVKFL